MNADSFPPHRLGRAVLHVGGIDEPGRAWCPPPPGLTARCQIPRCWCSPSEGSVLGAHTATLWQIVTALSFTQGNEGSKRVNHFTKVTKQVSEKYLGSSLFPQPRRPPTSIYKQFIGSNNLRGAGFTAKCKRKTKLPASVAANLP